MDDIKIYWVDEMNLHDCPGESNRDVAVVYEAKVRDVITKLQKELNDIKAAIKGNCADVVQVEEE